MDHTPKRPRIHATICGAPKIAAIPTIAPITQPQEIFPTEAAIASAMTSNAAIGVAIVRAKLKREVAPVLNGDACANAATGRPQETTLNQPETTRRRIFFFVL
jgi:hypothetical protein